MAGWSASVHRIHALLPAAVFGIALICPAATNYGGQSHVFDRCGQLDFGRRCELASAFQSDPSKKTLLSHSLPLPVGQCGCGAYPGVPRTEAWLARRTARRRM